METKEEIKKLKKKKSRGGQSSNIMLKVNVNGKKENKTVEQNGKQKLIAN